MKVLLSAYSCLPEEGSEPGTGWNWAQAIAANGHDVAVITRAVNKERIEAFSCGHAVEPVQYVFHDLAPALQRIYRLPFGNYLYYLLWQYTASKRALELHQAKVFDCVQHVTWCSFRVPSFMGQLGIPFIFGPVGGGEDTPKRLRPGLGWRGRMLDALRRTSTALMAPLMASTYTNASEIVATTTETLSKIPAKHRHKGKIQQAIGIDLNQIQHYFPNSIQYRAQRSSTRLELLYAGRLLPWKGLHLILKALALLGGTKSNIRFTVIGMGKDLSRLQNLSRQLKLDEIVSWIPRMPREKLMESYSNFDLFTFPSLHDSGGMVVLEALAFGLPVICLDLGGPCIAVNDSCGRVISTAGASEDQVVTAIAQFLNEILADPRKLLPLSHSARARAAKLTWQANVNSIHGGSPLTQLSRLEGATIAEI
jgi:glycosyltransferase involved in cell wall biosynthesis